MMCESGFHRPVAIAFICDDGYVMPTCVAITSLIRSKNRDTRYEIHIVCASLSEDNEEIFKQFQCDQIRIHIIRQSAERFAGLHEYYEGTFCVATPAALLKFVLPELLPEHDKVLYLDGDLVVRDDLSELYFTDLGSAYLGAVVDSGSLYFRSKFNDRVQNYFNSGVMLLNLAQMRKDNLSETLIRTKTELNDSSLMDQDVFNCVCDKNMITLPIRYNLLAINLIRSAGKWSLEQINGRYGTTYADEAGLFADAAIIHFSSKDKPWKDPSVAFSDEWYRCYYRTPVAHTLVRGNQMDQNDAHIPKVSVILPMQNPDTHLEEAVASLRNQTLRDIEIICIDDGSVDGTGCVLDSVAAEDARVRVYRQENQGPGKAYNFGVDLAKGRYIYFMDSRALLDRDALEVCCESALWNDLDVVLFEGTEQAQLGESPAYHRKKLYPYVYSGEEAFALLSQNRDMLKEPCLKLYRREYLLREKTDFPEKLRGGAEYFDFRSLISAGKVKILNAALCCIRDEAASETADLYQNYVRYHETACRMMEYLRSDPPGDDAMRAAVYWVSQYLTDANALYLRMDQGQREYLKNDPAVRRIDDAMLAPVLSVHRHYYFHSTDNRILEQCRRECEQLRKENRELLEEKRIRWEELQKLYREKGQRWNELQGLYKEKGERWTQLQTLKKENAQLKQLVNELQTQNEKLKQKTHRAGINRDGTVVLRIHSKIAGFLMDVAVKLKGLFNRDGTT